MIKSRMQDAPEAPTSSVPEDSYTSAPNAKGMQPQQGQAFNPPFAGMIPNSRSGLGVEGTAAPWA